MRTSYPYISKASDGRFHLFCGVCKHSNPFLYEVSKGIPNLSIKIIACGNCRSKGNGQPSMICNIGDIKDIATKCASNPEEIDAMIRDVTQSLDICNINSG